MTSLAEILANTGVGDKVLLRADGGINVVPSEMIDDPRELLPRAPLLRAYGYMYLGEEISQSDIDAAAQALPQGENDVRTVLEGYVDYFGGPVQQIMSPILRQTFLQTVELKGGNAEGLDVDAIKRREIFGYTMAAILCQVE
jgi:hypothetical protein